MLWSGPRSSSTSIPKLLGRRGITRSHQLTLSQPVLVQRRGLALVREVTSSARACSASAFLRAISSSMTFIHSLIIPLLPPFRG